MKVLYFDCACGISGDMTVGALIDAGADFGAIKDVIKSLPISGFELRADKVNKHGVMATQFAVGVDATAKQPHRHLRHMVEIIEQGNVPERTRAAALATFRLLAEAEAAVHGTTIEKVHFHEVGAIDSIVDIVAAHLALELLQVDVVYASPLNVGGGTVSTQHGILPVPAPATAKLLQGKPTYSGEVQFELVTPTGAALLCQAAAGFGPMPIMSVEAIGYGSGTRDLADRPNVLRAFVGVASERPKEADTISVIEANVDDMTPEMLPPLVSALLQAGARDAFITPIIGKKGRPAFCISVLAEPGQAQQMASTLLQRSSTFGVRIREERRIVLDRAWRHVATPWGKVSVKVGSFGGEQMTVAPEFESCRAVAESAGVAERHVYEHALAAAVKGDWENG